MLRARTILITLAVALFPVGCAPVGCAGEDPEMDATADEQWKGVVEQPLASPGQRGILGTWKGDTTHSGLFETLVFMSDGRFHGARNVTCVKAPCPPIAEDGTYKLFSRDARTYVELIPLSKQPDRYEYGSDGATLKIRPLKPGSEWYAMPQAGTAWCGGERDCGLQALPPGPCAGSYVCGAANACTWKCTAGGTEAAVAPGTDTAVDPNAKPGVDPAKAGLCPAVGACATADADCKKNPRDVASCETATKCTTCYPNGFSPKTVPDTADPGTNPVLGK